MSIKAKIIGVLQGVYGLAKSGLAQAWTVAGTLAITAADFITITVPDARNVTFVGGGNGSKVIFQTDGSTQVRLQKGAFDLGADGLIGWTATAGNGNLGNDTTLGRVAAGVVGAFGASGAGSAWVQNTAGHKRCTTAPTNATATLSSGVLSDLTITLVAGRKYTGVLVLFVKNSTAAEGLQVDFNGGAATMTSFQAGIGGAPGATIGTAVAQALATAMTLTSMGVTTDIVVTIPVSLVCNAAGTIIPRFAEVSHTSGTVTVELGSYFKLDDSAN